MRTILASIICRPISAQRGHTASAGKTTKLQPAHREPIRRGPSEAPSDRCRDPGWSSLVPAGRVMSPARSLDPEVPLELAEARVEHPRQVLGAFLLLAGFRRE